jgi:hypothetical protein
LPWPKSFIETNSDFVFFFAHLRFLAWANDGVGSLFQEPIRRRKAGAGEKAAVGKTD